MHIERSLSLRTRTGLVAAVVLGVVGIVPLSATAARADTSTCANARASVTEARNQHGVAVRNLAKARKALKKARAAHKPAKVRAAKKNVDRIARRKLALGRLITARQDHANAACAAPQATPRAVSAGRMLGLLTQAKGLDLGTIDAGQLTDLLDSLVPGLSDQLNPAQLTALLNGYNDFAAGDVDPAVLLAELGSAFSLGDVQSLLGGLAGADLLTDLAASVLGQFQGLLGGGSLPSLTDLLADPAGLLEALTGSVLPTLCSIVPLPGLCD